MVCADRRSTWGEFSGAPHRLAAHFQSLGLTAGSKVAIDLPNRPEYLETFYAALVLGAVPVNVNYRYTADEVHYVVDDSDAKVVVHSADVTRAVTKACKRIQRPWRPATLEVGAPYEAGARSGGTDAGPAARTERRRPRLHLHRRHDRHAQGRDVAQRGPVRRVVGAGAPERTASRPTRSWPPAPGSAPEPASPSRR